MKDVTKGEIECRRKVIEFFNYLRKYAIGFENAELVSIAPAIGFRDSRRIVGRYRLTREDVDGGRKFDDGIGIFPKFYDVVSLTGAWQWGEDCFFNHSKDGDYFTVPYRSMVPVIIDNLIVAGRCISADHMAESAVRAVYCCMCTGQAAGIAAAIAVENETKIGDINISELRKRLSAQGVALH